MEEISAYNAKRLTAYRRHDIGFVFQFYNLVPNLTALENVELASQICKNPMDAAEVLRSVGLGERLNNFPAQLSGGEQQPGGNARGRAQIARYRPMLWRISRRAERSSVLTIRSPPQEQAGR